MSGGFISRWSKKKIDARAELAKSERLPAPEEQAEAVPAAESNAARISAPAAGTVPAPAIASHSAPTDSLPPVESLTPESDFRPFLRPEVDPQLKNQALKTLFRDPHFNIMDGLDVYIDDYSKPDPLPESMLRQLNQSKMLKLFDEEEKEQAEQAEVSSGSAPGPDSPPAPLAGNVENLVQNDPGETKSPNSGSPIESQPHSEPK
jgi:hypothetical protein